MGRDAKYFPQPMDYKPERFSQEKSENDMTAFMPFGDGPRFCIGSVFMDNLFFFYHDNIYLIFSLFIFLAKRMGMVNVKVALVKILSNFNIEPMARQEIEFKFNSTPVLVPKNGLKIKLKKRM